MIELFTEAVSPGGKEIVSQVRGLTLVKFNDTFNTISIPICIGGNRMRSKRNPIRFQD